MQNDRYTQEDHAFREADPYALEKYEWTLDVVKRFGTGNSVLNVGCGAGYFNRLAAERGYIVTALEPDPAAVSTARMNATSGVTVHHTDIFEFSEKDRYGVIVAHDVLEHIDSDSAAVSKIAQLVAPGGLFIGSVPAMPWLFGLHDELLGHFRRYTRVGIERILQDELNVVSLRYFGLTGVPLVWYFSKLRRKPFPLTTTSDGKATKFQLAQFVCRIERKLKVPIGTSLLFVAQKQFDV